MTTLQLEVLEAFRSINIPEDKAAKVAAALSTAFGKGNPEQDARIGTIGKEVSGLVNDVGLISRDVGTLKTDVTTLKTDVAALKLDNVAIRGELSTLRWMGGVLLTMVTAILFKVFLH